MSENKQAKSIHYLSLIISAVALTVVVLFLLPWVDIPDTESNIDLLTGVDVATQSTELTDDDIIPSSVLFVTPLIAVGFLWEYYRKVTSPERPRRRWQYAGMMIIGIGFTCYWYITYATQASECLQSGQCISATQAQSEYTTQEVIENLYTMNTWIYLSLSLLLVVLPFWDNRPQAPKND